MTNTAVDANTLCIPNWLYPTSNNFHTGYFTYCFWQSSEPSMVCFNRDCFSLQPILFFLYRLYKFKIFKCPSSYFPPNITNQVLMIVFPQRHFFHFAESRENKDGRGKNIPSPPDTKVVLQLILQILTFLSIPNIILTMLFFGVFESKRV